jgi:hypothetical protein
MPLPWFESVEIRTRAFPPLTLSVRQSTRRHKSQPATESAAGPFSYCAVTFRDWEYAFPLASQAFTTTEWAPFATVNAEST